jgi:hypothetical protein
VGGGAAGGGGRRHGGGERAEAEELAAELESFGFAVRWEPGAMVLTHLRSQRVLRRSLAERWGMELRIRRDDE